MKKIYNAPTALLVEIVQTDIMLSLSETTPSPEEVNNGKYTIDVKEENASDGTLWNNEW